MRKKSARKVRTRHSNALGVAVFIGSLMGLLIIAALVIKVLLIFHQSVFDSKHQFVLALRKPQEVQFVVFNPDDESINSLVVTGNSPENPQKTFLVPVDVVASTSDTDASIPDIASSLVIHHSKLHTRMTFIDAIKLFLFTHSVDEKNEKTQSISFGDFANTQPPGNSFFIDNTLYKEGRSIAIINATNVSGLGTTYGTLLSTMGGNVISITSADSPSSTSSVGYIGNISYTASRLAHILHFPLVRLSGVQISDITVTIGTDASHLF